MTEEKYLLSDKTIGVLLIVVSFGLMAINLLYISNPRSAQLWLALVLLAGQFVTGVFGIVGIRK